MSKKIAVITGSPRMNCNSFTMTDALIKAAEKMAILLSDLMQLC